MYAAVAPVTVGPEGVPASAGFGVKLTHDMYRKWKCGELKLCFGARPSCRTKKARIRASRIALSLLYRTNKTTKRKLGRIRNFSAVVTLCNLMPRDFQRIIPGVAALGFRLQLIIAERLRCFSTMYQFESKRRRPFICFFGFGARTLQNKRAELSKYFGQCRGLRGESSAEELTELSNCFGEWGDMS